MQPMQPMQAQGSPLGRCRLRRTGCGPHQAPPVVEARGGLHEGQLQEVQARRRDHRPPPHQRVHDPRAAAVPARQVGLAAEGAPNAQRQRRAGRAVRDARRRGVRRQVAPARVRAFVTAGDDTCSVCRAASGRP